MSFDAPHIMLLDEPTNHLDIDAREALTQALNNYNGAVILVSHDPHLVDSVADRLWLVADGTCKPYNDDLEAYKTLVVQQRRKEREAEKKGARNKKGGDNKSVNSAEAAEQKVAELLARKDAIENEMSVCCTNNDTKQLKRLEVSFEELQKELVAAEAQWAAFLN